MSAADLVARVFNSEPTALTELYTLAQNFTNFFSKHLRRTDAEDRVHDLYIVAVETITTGKLRDPDRLMSFLTSVARNIAYTWIDKRRTRNHAPLHAHSAISKHPTPEQWTYNRERLAIAREALDGLDAKQQAVLVRFYLREEPWPEIAARMDLSDAAFRCAKSTALAEFGSRGRSLLRPDRRA